jgi:hypothetical protein
MGNFTRKYCRESVSYYSKHGSKYLELDRLVYLGALGFEKRCVSLNGKQKAHATVILIGTDLLTLKGGERLYRL